MEPVIRELREGDLQCGLLESLGSLRDAGIGQERAAGIFGQIASDPSHVVAVAELGGRIVGAATLLVEQKFIHGGGRAGHIEDVAVDGDHQGRGIGSALVRFLLGRAAEAGCYKTVLDCEEGLEPFYGRLGFRRAAVQMRLDH